MAKIYEEISKGIANSSGKPDSNLANDSNNLGGIPAEQYATQKYVKDYHNNKESNQKEYIDQQDQKILQEAKEYANSQIRNQDFSKFAKLIDVQAVDEKLSKELTNGLSTQKNHIDQEIKKVVDDTNANFTDVNNAISTLNSNQNNLFQSVSDGKNKIAGAITDKGVTTSANDSFDTMATNIRNIATGGGSGEIDPNYVDTSDATATASDLLVGKTAYSQGNKIYGTLIAQVEEGYPTYGTDTSNATATAEDIAYGKTAYARGEFITGTMPSNKEVEEIYGVDNNGYGLESQVAMTNDPITGDVISYRGLITFSKELDYCVSVTNLNSNNSVQYIESYAVNSQGMYIQQSSNVAGDINTKKYRYTKADLGISDNETIISMKLGSPGLEDDINKCLLIILTKSENSEKSTDSITYYDIKAHLYTYHLSENGAIGKMYETENVIETTKIIATVPSGNGSSKLYRNYFGIVTFNNNSSQVFFIRKYLLDYYEYLYVYNCKLINNELIKYDTLSTSSSGSTVVSSGVNGVRDIIKVSTDDKFIYSSDVKGTLKFLVQNNTEQSIYVPKIIEKKDCHAFINGTNKYIRASNEYLYVHEIGIDEYITLKSTNTKEILNLLITPDNKKLIALSYKYSSGSYSEPEINVYNVEEILVSSDSISPQESFLLSYGQKASSCAHDMYTNSNGSKILIYSSSFKTLHNLSSGLDLDNLIGIKYKNQYFYNVKEQSLTAGQGDVRKGKTFIGWMGYPENGTMEVTE